ncbi:hypothetical protein QUA41_30695 [Microcoleus sp. Pol11C1]|uniref:hypothetical protein n=1 Tax=unclassified Microcoleus TaxID=2642155 RepID=UPI002FD0E4CF
MPRINRRNSYLLHLSSVSFVPADIVSIHWHKQQEFSKKVVTQVRTRYETFIFEADSPNYAQDMELLLKALNLTERLEVMANAEV